MSAGNTENIDWINTLRIIALYAVIILHCTAPLLMQYGKIPVFDWWVADFFNAITRFAVPAFVMITGALLLHREYEIGDFLRKRLSRIVLPFLFWSLVYVCYAWYNEEIIFGPWAWTNIKQVLHLLKVGSSYHLWYVYMLIGLYFLIPVMAKFVRNASEKEILYFLAVWFGLMLFSQPYLTRYYPLVDMHYFSGYAGYLVLGHYLTFRQFNIKNLTAWMVTLLGCSLALIIIGTKVIMGEPNLPGTMFYEPLNPAVVMLSISVFMVVKLTMTNVPGLLTRVRDFAGRYNYGIYLSHALVLYFLDDPFGISYKLGWPIVSIPATALLCFALSLLLVWLISKLPLGKWVAG